MGKANFNKVFTSVSVILILFYFFVAKNYLGIVSIHKQKDLVALLVVLLAIITFGISVIACVVWNRFSASNKDITSDKKNRDVT